MRTMQSVFSKIVATNNLDAINHDISFKYAKEMPG